MQTHLYYLPIKVYAKDEMLIIIITLIVSLILAFIATQNATLVTLHLGDTTLSNIPLFFVVLASILAGFLVSSIVTVINLIKSKITIMGQKGQLKKTYKTVEELQGRVVELEEENVTLKEQINILSK